MSEHSSLTPERWAKFDLPRQILQIAVELQRGLESLRPEHRESLQLSYERVLRLTDLTVQVQPRLSLRRELLRWRELIAVLYSRDESDAAAHRDAIRTLLELDPVTANQIDALTAHDGA